jgi:hypothetical protein
MVDDHNRDPLFIACFNGNHEGYKDDPQYTLINSQGELILRTDEQLLFHFFGDIMMLRFPDQRWLINNETIHDWGFYLTTERLVVTKKVLFSGAFEFFDHIETYGKFAGLHPTEEISINQFFHWLEHKDKFLQQFTLAFQLAYTRCSMVSCIKTTSTQVNGVECWYEDAPDSQTEIQIFPSGLDPKAIYNFGVQLQGASLKEKLRCIQKKHQLDPNWEIENYNTYLTSIQRLANAPDFLAMGSGTTDSDSFDPITFQPHPINWDTDVFTRSLTGNENIRIINLKY